MAFFCIMETMKPEILAPVGNVEHLQAALAAGCDAVYFALQEFGARAFAKNFTYQQAKQAIDQCHLVGVKVYIVMNTVLFPEEIEMAYQQAKTCYEMGVDALIVQDLGLIYLIHKRLPQATIHASTQMSVTEPEQIQRLKQLGVKRVVLARECSKEMVQVCKETGMEIEIFIHGALCISMSGRCLFSSFKYDRSGNRGQCAQPCRMKYSLWQEEKKIKTDGQYLLSPKDVSIIDHVQELNVDSLKIEGRMKSSEYVYESVFQTRKVLDGKVRTKQDVEKLQTAFYRGYTLGHYYQEKGFDLMNQQSCNHRGVPIGKVHSIHQGKIWISLEKDLWQHDGIRMGDENGCIINYLYDRKGRLQNHIASNQLAGIEKMDGIKVGQIVYRTLSAKLRQDVQQAIEQSSRQCQVEIDITCKKVGNPLMAHVRDGENEWVIESSQVSQEAKNQPLSKEIVCKQLNKTQNTSVQFHVGKVDLADNLFFTVQAINQWRRDIVDQIEKNRVFVQPLVEQEDSFDGQIEHVEGIYTSLNKEVATQDWNITNAYAILGALEMGYQAVLVSEEVSNAQCEMLCASFKELTGKQPPLIKMIYGHRRVMIMNHCPVNTNLSDGQRKNCSLCHHNQYSLKGLDGTKILLEGNEKCQMELFEHEPINRIEQVSMYKKMGIQAYYIYPKFMSETQLKNAIDKVKNEL